MAEAYVPFIPGATQIADAKEIVSLPAEITPGSNLQITAKNTINYALLYINAAGFNLAPTPQQPPQPYFPYQYPMIIGPTNGYYSLPLYEDTTETYGNNQYKVPIKKFWKNLKYYVNGTMFVIMPLNNSVSDSYYVTGMIAFF